MPPGSLAFRMHQIGKLLLALERKATCTSRPEGREATRRWTFSSQ